MPPGKTMPSGRAGHLRTYGAHDRSRTDDPVLTKNVLYLLSYVGTSTGPQKARSEPGGQGRIRTSEG